MILFYIKPERKNSTRAVLFQTWLNNFTHLLRLYFLQSTALRKQTDSCLRMRNSWELCISMFDLWENVMRHSIPKSWGDKWDINGSEMPGIFFQLLYFFFFFFYCHQNFFNKISRKKVETCWFNTEDYISVSCFLCCSVLTPTHSLFFFPHSQLVMLSACLEEY